MVIKISPNYICWAYLDSSDKLHPKYKYGYLSLGELELTLTQLFPVLEKLTLSEPSVTLEKPFIKIVSATQTLQAVADASSKILQAQGAIKGFLFINKINFNEIDISKVRYSFYKTTHPAKQVLISEALALIPNANTYPNSLLLSLFDAHCILKYTEKHN
jgi:hypothetical protein